MIKGNFTNYMYYKNHMHRKYTFNIFQDAICHFLIYPL